MGPEQKKKSLEDVFLTGCWGCHFFRTAWASMQKASLLSMEVLYFGISRFLQWVDDHRAVKVHFFSPAEVKQLKGNEAKINVCK